MKPQAWLAAAFEAGGERELGWQQQYERQTDEMEEMGSLWWSLGVKAEGCVSAGLPHCELKVAHSCLTLCDPMD